MTFNEVLTANRSKAIQALMARAATLNRMAKTVARAGDRRRLYERKTETISWLMVLGGGRVSEILLEQGLATVSLLNGRRLHVPINRLSPEAREIVWARLQERLTGVS